MSRILDRYLDRVLVYANKTESDSEAIRQELKDHLLQKVDDLAASGLAREEAILETLRQHGAPKVIGYKLRGSFPWIDIRSHGTARGVIAIGPKAVGIFAFGGIAIGVVACGGVAAGLVSGGGLALGLLLAWGGCALGGLVNGGLAIGLIAVGGLAIGVLAKGGLAVGAWVSSGGPHAMLISYYTAATVPPFLKSMEPLLEGATWINRHILMVLPIYLLGALLLSLAQYREGKRTSPKDEDWLIDS